MPRWNSLHEMAADLHLAANPSDRDALRAEIRAARAAIHPDHNEGKFKDTADEDRFHKLSDALELCDRPPSTALIPLQDVAALVKVVREALLPAASRPEVEDRIEYRHAARAEMRDRLVLPRIGSGVFAAACAALLGFSDKLKDESIIGPLFRTSVGRYAVLAAFLYSGVCFILTWWLEQQEAARTEWLSTDSGRRVVVRQVLANRHLDEDASNEPIAFSAADMVSAIRDIRRQTSSLWPRALLPFSALHASTASAEKLAKIHLDELERRGVIRKLDEKRLDVRYEMDPGTAGDISRLR